LNTIVKQIPNLLTLSNLLCGCLAIKYAFEWDLVMAAYLVGLAAVFDFLDGFAARLLKVSGEMGKQLDSLADMVSFGVVPGVVMFQMMRTSVYLNNDFVGYDLQWLSYLAFLIPLFSAYRLAKFNIDTRQTDKFIGLPTPANALFFCSFAMIIFSDNGYVDLSRSVFTLKIDTILIYNEPKFDLNGILYHLFFETTILSVCILTFSILLISELPLFALKFKNFGWSDNKIRYVFLTISLSMLIIFQVLAIPFIVILYILLSIVNNLIFKQ